MIKLKVACLVLCLSFMMAACAPSMREPGYTPLLDETTQTDTTAAVRHGSASPAQPLPSPIWLDPHYESTPTPPPPPTPLPTPMVTPVAVADSAKLAFAPTATDSFWVYYWKGNEVWRMDEQGGRVELLLDSRKAWGQWLTAVPDQLIGTECCLVGPRVVVSPDGQKLALVTVDKTQLASKDEPFAFSIYVFEIQSGKSYFIGQGGSVKWSPDSQHLAYVSAGGLWTADIKRGQTQQIVAPDSTNRQKIAEVAWLPSGTEIAYVYDEGHHRVPTLWLIDVRGDLPPRQLITLDYSIYQMVPTPDGKALLFLSAQGSREWSQYHLARNLWSVSLDSGELTPITQDMVIDGYTISPDGEWVLLSGYHLYEQPEETFARDLWLLDHNNNQLHRLTADYGYVWAADWSPDGSRPLAWDGVRLFSVTLSNDSLWQAIAPGITENFAVGGAK